MRHASSRRSAFALYEVLLGVAVFVIGVLALGRSVENCINATVLNSEESRVRLILANRMAEIQATPGVPDPSKETKIDSSYGAVKLIQKSQPSNLTDDDGNEMTGIRTVLLTAEWMRGGVKQSKSVEFYVYRSG
jgi:Tfp pilus assembly protein PilV